MGRWRALAAVALGALLGATAAGGSGASARATTSADCQPRPAALSVPAGSRAVRFRVLALQGGSPCAGGGEAREGFSLRRGATTVFVHYREPSGRSVWDPIPLSDLVLPPGDYSLLAAPAAGASVALAWELVPEN